MFCTPTVCCVQPTEYTRAVVRSRPELSHSASATSTKRSRGTPQTSSTTSTV